MHDVRNTNRALRLAVALLALFLAACDTATPTPQTVQEFKYVTTVEISATTDQTELEAAYGGTAFVFRPEAGFAILGFEEAGLSVQGAHGNEDIFRTPEVSSHGRGVWGGGRGVWGGGLDAWAGSASPTLAQNNGYWDKINLPEGQALAPNLGRGVKIAVIDTGIDLNHPVFQGRLAPAHEWWDFVDQDSYPQEEAGSSYGHGTGVAGIVLQVAPNATILPLRVLNGGGLGDVDDVVSAIDVAVWRGADIINLSLGTELDVKSLEMLVSYARNRGVIVVASSGNQNKEWLEFPAQYDYAVLSIGSVTYDDVKSDFSSYGRSLDLLAPGETVYTALPDNQLGYWTGTSFAAPMVSGALALAIGEVATYPQMSPGGLISQAITQADNINGLSENWMFGTWVGGRLNVEAFLQAAFGS